MAQSLMRLLLFQCDDAGRSKSNRPRSKNDCTVRAVAMFRKTGFRRAVQVEFSLIGGLLRSFAPASFFNDRSELRRATACGSLRPDQSRWVRLNSSVTP